MSDGDRDEYRGDSATHNSWTNKKGKRSPNQFGNFVDVFRIQILGNKLHSGTTQPQVENIEIAEEHHGDGEDAVLIRAKPPNYEGNCEDTNGHGRNLANQVENGIFCD